MCPDVRQAPPSRRLDSVSLAVTWVLPFAGLGSLWGLTGPLQMGPIGEEQEPHGEVPGAPCSLVPAQSGCWAKRHWGPGRV